jgi:hypothetical protein
MVAPAATALTNPLAFIVATDNAELDQLPPEAVSESVVVPDGHKLRTPVIPGKAGPEIILTGRVA